MRVCHIIEATSGGTIRASMDLAHHLVAQGDDVAFIYSPLRAEKAFYDEMKGAKAIKFIALPMKRSLSLYDFWSLVRLVFVLHKMGPFDILHAHSSKAGGLVRLAKLFLVPGKQVYTPHAFITMSPQAPAFFKLIEWLLSYLSDKIIAVSRKEKEHAIQKMRMKSSKIQVIPNGIAFKPTETRSAARKKMGLHDNDYVVGFVGRLVAQKNLPRLIEAFSILKAEKQEARLALIGNGDLLEAVRKDIQRSNLDQDTFFYVNHQARQLMPAFDVLCCSSDYEGFPIIFLEALVTGTPIVTTPVGGVDEAVKHGETGFVTQTFSAQALGEDLLKTAQKTPQERVAMAQAARALASNFTIEHMGTEVRALYADLLSSKAGAA